MARYGVPISRVTSERDSGTYFPNATGLLHDKSNDGASAKDGNGARAY